MIEFREATETELATWDDLTVTPEGGHVLQSTAWARYRERAGWQPRFLVGADGSGVLALLKPWPAIGGASGYISRGPVPTADAAQLADRLDGATRWLFANGVDVVATDPQLRAGSDYVARIEAAGFKPIEEIQPSRHRLSVALGPEIDEEGALRHVTKQTRQRIRKAEDDGLEIVRYDATIGAGEGSDVGDGFLEPGRPVEEALGEFYGFLTATAERRHFEVLSRRRFLDWTTSSYAASQTAYLEARERDGGPIAGLVLYRHGRRLSTFLSGDRDDARERQPGAFHLLRWRAIQLAIREGCVEMDLDGADLAGARDEPKEGDPTYGLYQHKKSFGAEWVEQEAAHERVARPVRYLVGRVASGALRRLRGGGRP